VSIAPYLPGGHLAPKETRLFNMKEEFPYYLVNEMSTPIFLLAEKKNFAHSEFLSHSQIISALRDV
jgi:hypothetical protein